MINASVILIYLVIVLYTVQIGRTWWVKRELINKIAALFRRAKTEAAHGASGMPDHPACIALRFIMALSSFFSCILLPFKAALRNGCAIKKRTSVSKICALNILYPKITSNPLIIAKWFEPFQFPSVVSALFPEFQAFSYFSIWTRKRYIDRHADRR